MCVCVCVCVCVFKSETAVGFSVCSNRTRNVQLTTKRIYII